MPDLSREEKIAATKRVLGPGGYEALVRPWVDALAAAEQRAEDNARAATGLSADLSAMGQRAEKAEAEAKVCQEREHRQNLARLKAEAEVERLRPFAENPGRTHDDEVARIKADAERLVEALREIAAYDDDCIHRRMARAALAQHERERA